MEERDPAGAGQRCPAARRTRPPRGRRIPRPPPPRPGGARRGSGGRRRAPARARPRGTRRSRRARRRAPSGSGRGCRRRTSDPSLTRNPSVRPPLCGTSTASTVNPSASKVPHGNEAEPPVAAELVRPDGEERRRHHPREQGLGVGVVVLCRQEQRHPCVLAVATGEEGQALDVVPVQVRQQDACRGRGGRRGARACAAVPCRHRGAASATARSALRRATARRTRCARRSGCSRDPVRASIPGSRRR